MFDSKLRKQIGARAKQRRLELNLPMQYVADQLGVNKSTVQRYESGAIDNTKKMVLEGLSRVLDVTPEWLTGETDILDPEVTDSLELKIRDSYRRILGLFPLKLNEQDSDFADMLGMSSDAEFRQMMFLREIMHTVNNLKEASDILQTYPADSQVAQTRLNRLIKLLPTENHS